MKTMKLPTCFRRIKHVPVFLRIALVAVAAALLFNSLFQLTFIRGTSMEPLAGENTFVLGARFSYWGSEPQYGDIVVFQKKSVANETLIKLVAGVPGDRILIENGTLYRNDRALCTDGSLEDMPLCIVPDRSYFVIGVNFAHSNDSRHWADRFVTKEEIKSKVLMKGHDYFGHDH